MDRYEILETLENMAEQQGFYARLLFRLNEMKFYNPVGYEKYIQELESENFTDEIDLLMYFESKGE